MNFDREIVSIIVPCYNEEATIASLLNAIAAQDFPMERLEVIIADGMSVDGTRARIEEFSSAHAEMDIKIIDNHRRIIPAALNRAVAAAAGDIVIRLDAHSMPASDYVSRCVEIHSRMDVANVGGEWEIRPGKKSWVARGIAAATSHPLGAGGARYRVGGPAGLVETVPFGAFRRDWLESVGPFNEALLTNEDYEYNVRIHAAGGIVYFDPQIRSIYFARPDLLSLARQYARYGFWKARMLHRYPSTVRVRQLIPPVFVGSLILLSLLTIWVPFVWIGLAVELGVYAALVIAAAVLEVVKRKDPGLIVSFPIAILAIHLFWGGAFLVGMVNALLRWNDAAR